LHTFHTLRYSYLHSAAIGWLVRRTQARSGSLYLLGFLVVGLGAALRALGEVDLDEAHGLGFRHAVHGSDLARHAVERGFIELAFGIGLLRLVVGAVEVAHHLGDRDQVAGVDLGVILLRAARPHGALHAGAALHDLQCALDIILFGQLAHADGGRLGDRHLQAHLVLLEIDHEEFKLVPRHFLLVDRHDLSDAVRRVHDVLAGLETVARRGLLVLSGSCHYALNSLLWPPAASRQTCYGPRGRTRASGNRRIRRNSSKPA